MSNLKKIRLKDLENISKEKTDYSIIMKEVVGYKNPFRLRKIFEKKFKEAHYLISKAKKLSPKECKLNPESKIKIPEMIDIISFKAMMELQIHASDTTLDTSVYIAKYIAIATFESNISNILYDQESLHFQNYVKRILEQPLEDMFALYYHLEKMVDESIETWSRLFFEVEVNNPDYENAGGQRMNKFNVITTIRKVCNDFNVEYDKAWHLPYGIVQTNNLSHATAAYIQNEMRIIKERKYKAKRGVE